MNAEKCIHSARAVASELLCSDYVVVFQAFLFLQLSLVCCERERHYAQTLKCKSKEVA